MIKKDEKIKNTLLFFKKNLTDLNSERLYLNKVKPFVKYMADSHVYTDKLIPMNQVMGVMSFSLYYLRFAVNIELLVNKKIKEDQLNALYYNLFNDILWGTVNLAEFFWLTFNLSESAGFKGLQLDSLAQVVDLLIIIIRHQQDAQAFKNKLNMASDAERYRLEIEWHFKELNVVRILITGTLIVSVISMFAFSIASISPSPIIFLINLINSFLRMLINVEKDKQIIQHISINGADPKRIADERQTLFIARTKDVVNLVIDFTFFPVCFYLIITTSIPLPMLCLFALMVVRCGLTAGLDAYYGGIKKLGAIKPPFAIQ